MNEKNTTDEYIVCQDCDGRGYLRNNEWEKSYTCPKCGGKGDIKIIKKKEKKK